MQLYEAGFQSPMLERMAPKERSTWWVWILALCAGTGEKNLSPLFAVARAAGQEPSSKDTGQSGQLETVSYFTWTAESTERNATWVTTNTAISAGGELTTAISTVLVTVKDTTGHKTGASSSSSVKYWVPLAFMVIALTTLYFTYKKSTERESRSRAGSLTLSSDSDSQDNQVTHGAAHTLPHPEAWNQIDEGMLQAKEAILIEENEQTVSDPEPSPSQNAAPHTAEATKTPPS